MLRPGTLVKAAQGRPVQVFCWGCRRELATALPLRCGRVLVLVRACPLFSFLVFFGLCLAAPPHLGSRVLCRLHKGFSDGACELPGVLPCFCAPAEFGARSGASELHVFMGACALACQGPGRRSVGNQPRSFPVSLARGVHRRTSVLAEVHWDDPHVRSADDTLPRLQVERAGVTSRRGWVFGEEHVSAVGDGFAQRS